MSTWIQWSGAICPVPEDTVVTVRLRNGEEHEGKAGFFYWDTPGNEGEITRYRVMPSETPKLAPITVSVRIVDLDEFNVLLTAIRANWDGIPATVKDAYRQLYCR